MSFGGHGAERVLLLRLLWAQREGGARRARVMGSSLLTESVQSATTPDSTARTASSASRICKVSSHISQVTGKQGKETAELKPLQRLFPLYSSKVVLSNCYSIFSLRVHNCPGLPRFRLYSRTTALTAKAVHFTKNQQHLHANKL